MRYPTRRLRLEDGEGVEVGVGPAEGGLEDKVKAFKIEMVGSLDFSKRTERMYTSFRFLRIGMAGCVKAVRRVVVKRCCLCTDGVCEIVWGLKVTVCWGSGLTRRRRGEERDLSTPTRADSQQPNYSRRAPKIPDASPLPSVVDLSPRLPATLALRHPDVWLMISQPHPPTLPAQFPASSPPAPTRRLPQLPHPLPRLRQMLRLRLRRCRRRDPRSTAALGSGKRCLLTLCIRAASASRRCDEGAQDVGHGERCGWPAAARGVDEAEVW